MEELIPFVDMFPSSWLIAEVLVDKKLKIRVYWTIWEAEDKNGNLKEVGNIVSLQKWVVNRKGRWQPGRGRLNIPYDKFPQFVRGLNKVVKKEFTKKNQTGK